MLSHSTCYRYAKRKRATLEDAVLAATTPEAKWRLVVSSAQADTTKVRAVLANAIVEHKRNHAEISNL